jgi:hypothetical protein
MHTRSRTVIICQHFLTEIRLGVASMASRSGRGGAQTWTFGAASTDLTTDVAVGTGYLWFRGKSQRLGLCSVR